MLVSIELHSFLIDLFSSSACLNYQMFLILSDAIDCF